MHFSIPYNSFFALFEFIILSYLINLNLGKEGSSYEEKTLIIITFPKLN